MRSAALLGFLFAVGLLAAVFIARPASAPAADGTLTASVGPGFSISLTQNGSAVTSLAPGTYDIDVSDTATVHNFHLSGPGVDQATSVPGTESTTWTVTFSPGSYHFQCDAHPTMLHGDFTVTGGGGTTSTVATTTSPVPPTTTAPSPTPTGATTTGSTMPAGTTTEATTTTAPTTTQAAGTTSITATTHTIALTARVRRVSTGRRRIAVSVSVNRPALATADLLNLRGARMAHLTKRIQGTTTLTLRPTRPLARGVYRLRLRVSAGGQTTFTAQTIRVA
jgi:hypothetical protein